VSDEKTSLTAALRHLAEQERRTPSEHATPGELTAYHEGTLPPPVEARVREHLAHCKLCSDLLLDLAGFADLAPPPGVPELTDAEVDEDWQALRERMRGKAAAAVVPFPAPVAQTPARSPRKRLPWRYAAAAAIVAVAVGLSSWRLASNSGPLKSFDQGQTVRGSESPGEHMSVNQPAEFTFYPPESYPQYEGRILREDGQEVWKTSDVKQIAAPPPADRMVSFRISDNVLEPGSYQAVLLGVEDGPPRTVARIYFEVDAP
jgi:hypothetical protein